MGTNVGTSVESDVGFLAGCGSDWWVDYDSAEIPTTGGENLVVVGAQVGLPAEQPDVLKLPSHEKVFFSCSNVR